MISQSPARWTWPRFLALLLGQLWVGHAVVFFAHEYAHSFTAWALRWKIDPFTLHVPAMSAKVWLLQLGIDQGVNGAAIFAAGRAGQAALISAAGVLGNLLLTLPLGLMGYRAARRAGRAALAMLSYWVVVASVGNLLDYVPIRTFTDGTDLTMDTYAVELGLHWSPWMLLAVTGFPFLAVLVWFFARMEPAALAWMFPQAPAQRVLSAVLTAFLMFCFYGAAGWSDAGPISHRLSVLSVCVAFPLMAALSAWLVKRQALRTQAALLP